MNAQTKNLAPIPVRAAPDENPGAAPQPTPSSPPRRRRLALIAALPVALVIAGGAYWITSGRYVSTDDAYVQQDRVTIVPEVPGRIVKVGVTENEQVNAGDLLFQLDESSYKALVDEAEASVASAKLEVEKLKAAYAKAVSDQEMAEQALQYARDDFERQQALAKRGIVAQSALDKAELDLRQAQSTLESAKQSVLSAKAALSGNPEIAIADHPEVLAAVAKLEKAQLDLQHTVVSAPSAGIVSQSERLQVGQYIMPGTAVLSLVQTGRSWIEANFKETDLTHVSAGQAVSISIDTYPGHPLEGRVESLGAATGAEFSLLPAQNATGNWVKVVQRIPVRISLAASAQLPALRSGMSASVSVDTGRGPISALGAE
jgi:membrane fusion protein (multidrug efflux system)